MISAVNAHRFRWVNYAACLWALLFAAPHVWWALGFLRGSQEVGLTTTS